MILTVKIQTRLLPGALWKLLERVPGEGSHQPGGGGVLSRGFSKAASSVKARPTSLKEPLPYQQREPEGGREVPSSSLSCSLEALTDREIRSLLWALVGLTADTTSANKRQPGLLWEGIEGSSRQMSSAVAPGNGIRGDEGHAHPDPTWDDSGVDEVWTVMSGLDPDWSLAVVPVIARRLPSVSLDQLGPIASALVQLFPAPAPDYDLDLYPPLPTEARRQRRSGAEPERGVDNSLLNLVHGYDDDDLTYFSVEEEALLSFGVGGGMAADSLGDGDDAWDVMMEGFFRYPVEAGGVEPYMRWLKGTPAEVKGAEDWDGFVASSSRRPYVVSDESPSCLLSEALSEALAHHLSSQSASVGSKQRSKDIRSKRSSRSPVSPSEISPKALLPVLRALVRWRASPSASLSDRLSDAATRMEPELLDDPDLALALCQLLGAASSSSSAAANIPSAMPPMSSHEPKAKSQDYSGPELRSMSVQNSRGSAAASSTLKSPPLWRPSPALLASLGRVLSHHLSDGESIYSGNTETACNLSNSTNNLYSSNGMFVKSSSLAEVIRGFSFTH